MSLANSKQPQNIKAKELTSNETFMDCNLKTELG